jgi:hypothetical protein
MARKNAAETLDWLQQQALVKVRESLNQPKIRARLGLYGGEVIPTNERNLTDTRNRVSLIYEYLFADTLTELLSAEDEFCAYVVANRFPDLEVRNSRGSRGLRLEVKCLQATAEEKAANFSTLLKDIHPDGDYLIVFLWEWGWDAADVDWDRAPLIVDIFAFNAYALAQLRDWYWLNRPGNNQGDAYQGYDLRGAITANAGDYKEEEGNYGKLLRIWDKDFSLRPPMDKVAERTEADYVRFREVALSSGFESLSRTILQSVIDEHEIRPLELNHQLVGYQRGRHWFVLGSKVDRDALTEAMRREGALDVVMFNDKYLWNHCRLAGERLETITGAQKPKHLGAYLNTQYLRNLGED